MLDESTLCFGGQGKRILCIEHMTNFATRICQCNGLLLATQQLRREDPRIGDNSQDFLLHMQAEKRALRAVFNEEMEKLKSEQKMRMDSKNEELADSLKRCLTRFRSRRTKLKTSYEEAQEEMQHVMDTISQLRNSLRMLGTTPSDAEVDDLEREPWEKARARIV